MLIADRCHVTHVHLSGAPSSLSVCLLLILLLEKEECGASSLSHDMGLAEISLQTMTHGYKWVPNPDQVLLWK